MPETSSSQIVSSEEKKVTRSFRARVFDGYQPLRALTSKPPKGRTVGSNRTTAKPAKKAVGA
jgi:hypothetical protein